MGWNRNDEDYRADYERDERKHSLEPVQGLPVTQRDHELVAVLSLVGFCEGLCTTGAVSDLNERYLRRRIASVLSALGMSAANRDDRQ